MTDMIENYPLSPGEIEYIFRNLDEDEPLYRAVKELKQARIDLIYWTNFVDENKRQIEKDMVLSDMLTIAVEALDDIRQRGNATASNTADETIKRLRTQYGYV